MRVNVGDGGLHLVAGEQVGTVDKQIIEGLYTTDSTQGHLVVTYNMGHDPTTHPRRDGHRL